MPKRGLLIAALMLAVGVWGVSEMERGHSNEKEERARLFCKLSGEELRERIGRVRAGLLEQVLAVDELERGYRFWVPRSEGSLRSLADFVKAESDCCSFFDFEIALRSAEERVSLTLTGAPEAKRLLEQMLARAEFDPAAP